MCHLIQLLLRRHFSQIFTYRLYKITSLVLQCTLKSCLALGWDRDRDQDPAASGGPSTALWSQAAKAALLYQQD